MSNNFMKAYREVEGEILADKKLLKLVDLIALLGSVADKESSEGWSDLDVLIVLKSDKLGNIPVKNLDKLRDIASRISDKCSFPVSILSHTIDDFENYVAFEYLKHYSFGFCTYPSPDYLKNIIDEILEKRGIDESTRKAYCAYHMRHVRFNLLRKYVSWNRFNMTEFEKEFGKLLIDKMIKATDLALNYKDYWPKTKREILEMADKYLSEVDTLILKRGLELRKRWGFVSVDNLKDFTVEGLHYVSSVINLVLKDYREPTPEERMFS